MFILKGKRVKLSTLLKWASEEDGRAVTLSFSSKKAPCPRYFSAAIHEDETCETLNDNQLIDDISPKILGHKWMDGKTK